MGIKIREASDADIPRAAQGEADAYGAGQNGPSLFFPGPFPVAPTESRANQIINMRNSDPTCQLLIAVDEETGEQMGFAKYHIYKTSEDVSSSAGRPVPSGPGVNEAACEAFFGGLVVRKKAIMGTKPHIYLHMLHTEPKYQRRGAASALLRWGTERADQLGLPVYLESSHEAHILYGRHGFNDAETFECDMRPFGGDKTFTAPLMIRGPL
ncbi:hypothetical protein DPSP01_006328 [Paraphaeosphaeria sporulosa]|uniref:Acyl-CoA N-acyltransferase n=1 Tax=Paraphaeosphaeria sporulosa TaxID=1460663 RepID=A0A177CDK6_9PLEO|nr:acyl-CoA N-acyltransferase [Paraphaeosphaeria sporulosa]OAG05725.1 acyl-CoA N-acyltransferase [Paraphaeosphaeria sporulosa]